MRVGLLLWACLGVGCGPEVSDHVVLVTPGGRELELEGLWQIPVDESEAGLLLRYRTDLDLADEPALLAELDDVWQGLLPSAEQQGLSTAIVAVFRQPQGWDREVRGYQLIMRRDASGRWSRSDDDERDYWKDVL